MSDKTAYPPLILALAATSLLTPQLRAQAPSFAFATIRLSPLPIVPVEVREIPAGKNTLSAHWLTLNSLIRLAYDPEDAQPTLIYGGSGWRGQMHYDVEAIAGGSRVATPQERKDMLKTLLAERFHLALHRETRHVHAWALQTAEDGPTLTTHVPDETSDPDIQVAKTWLIAKNASTRDLANALHDVLFKADPERGEHPVIDQTGLTGRYDFEVEWTPSSMVWWGKRSDIVDRFRDTGDVFSEIKYQLGLKLKSTMIAADVLVIDHAEKPLLN